MASKFLERLHEEVLVGDGALGTQIYAHGVGLKTNYDSLNLTSPELVVSVHREYVAAGAQAVETNTFGANRSRLEPHGLADKVGEIALAGARLAREAAGEDVFVLGSVGPLGAPSGPRGVEQPSREEPGELFREPIVALAEGGVDAILLETFSNLDHLLAALEAAKSETDLPVLCQLAFHEQGFTFAGVSAERAVTALTAAGADAIGANCGRGVRGVMTAVRTMTSLSDLPVSAFPNAGLPEFVDGRFIYTTTPQYLADSAVEMAELGVNLIGGCCGTTPEYVRLIAEKIRGRKPAKRVHVAAVPKAAGTEVAEPSAPSTLSFLDRAGGGPLVAVELDPPRGLDYGYLLARARQLHDMGCDAITCGDNPVASVRMGNLALSQIIQQEVGLPCVFHLTCRDHNLIGLQSILLAACAMGLDHVLALTGDPARVGDQPGATSVYDLNSFGLVELISNMNRGKNYAGMDLKGRTRFTIGVALNPNSRNLHGQIERLRKKVDRGAHFAMTQPLFDVELARRMHEEARELGIRILLGIFPLLSERNAEFLHNEVPGIVLTDEVRRRMKGLGGEAGRKMGLAIGREIIDQMADFADGYYIVPPQNRTDLASRLVEHINARRRRLVPDSFPR